MPVQRVVLFDVDGVILDSYPSYQRIWRQWSDHHGLDFDVVWSATHGRTPPDTFRLVAPELDSEAEHLRLIEISEKNDEPYPAFSGAEQLLRSIPEHRWGLVTSGIRRHVIRRFELVGLPLPQVIVDGSDVERGKPSAECYLRAADLLAVPAEECLVLEDAPAGIASALSAGMTVLALGTTHNREELLDAHYFAVSLSVAVPIVRDWIL